MQYLEQIQLPRYRGPGTSNSLGNRRGAGIGGIVHPTDIFIDNLGKKITSKECLCCENMEDEEEKSLWTW